MGKDLSWSPLACLQVARGLQGYKVVEYIAFRGRDLKEGREWHFSVKTTVLERKGQCNIQLKFGFEDHIKININARKNRNFSHL